MNRPMDVLKEFPVRKSKTQKQQFRDAVQSYAGSLGYTCTVEKGSFGVRNVVIGDPEHADYLVTAHYDTCARLPFPNLITPCSFWLFMGWQILLTIILMIPLFVIGVTVGVLAEDPGMGVPIGYLALLAELGLMLFGPANRQNANDNTSGVVGVLEIAASLPPELRDRVCFVLFDLEEGGLLGSASYRSKHKKATNKQLIINLDCVGDGDEILFFPSKKLKKQKERMEKLAAKCSTDGKKSITLRDKGFSIYPSDQANFPLGLGVAAFCRSKWAGLYLDKIHTGKDKNIDEKNIVMLRDTIIALIRAHV